MKAASIGSLGKLHRKISTRLCCSLSEPPTLLLSETSHLSETLSLSCLPMAPSLPPFQNVAGFLFQFCKYHSHLGAKINWLEGECVNGAGGYLVNLPSRAPDLRWALTSPK